MCNWVMEKAKELIFQHVDAGNYVTWYTATILTFSLPVFGKSVLRQKYTKSLCSKGLLKY